MAAFGGVAVAAAALLIVQQWFAPAEPTTRSTLAFEGDAKFVSRGGVSIAFSPDGSQIVYAGGTDAPGLFLTQRTGAVPTRIAGVTFANSPLFTPDGLSIAYVANNALVTIPVSGGVPTTIADSVDRFSWSDGDVIVGTGPTGALSRVSATGGRMEVLAVPDTARRERFYSWPHLLPDGDAVLFNISLGTAPDSFQVAALRFSDRTVIRLGIHCLNPRYVSVGFLLCARVDGTVIAAPFDVKRLQVTGPAVTVLENVEVRGQGAANFAVSRSGALAYAPRGLQTQIVTVDRTGRSSVLVQDVRNAIGPRISPDGKRLALTIARGPNVVDVWIYDLDTRLLSRLTTDGRSSGGPGWSHDGKRLLYSRLQASGINSLYWRPWDGSGPETMLTDSAWGADMSPRGDLIVLNKATARFGRSYVASVAIPSLRLTPIRMLANAVDAAAVSPDGRWIAYQQPVDGRNEVFVEPLPGGGARHQVSATGGAEPVWSRDGRELFYYASRSLWVATVSTGAAFAVLRRDSLFAIVTPPAGTGAATNYDVMPDGQTFVVAQYTGGADPILVTGWFTELRALMAQARQR